MITGGGSCRCQHGWVAGRASSCLVPSGVAAVTVRPIVLIRLVGAVPLVPLVVEVVLLLIVMRVSSSPSRRPCAGCARRNRQSLSQRPVFPHLLPSYDTELAFPFPFELGAGLLPFSFPFPCLFASPCPCSSKRVNLHRHRPVSRNCWTRCGIGVWTHSVKTFLAIVHHDGFRVLDIELHARAAVHAAAGVCG